MSFDKARSARPAQVRHAKPKVSVWLSVDWRRSNHGDGANRCRCRVLSASPYPSYSERYRSRRRGHDPLAAASLTEESALAATAEKQTPDDGADFDAPTWVPAPATETASFASRFKADLSRLADHEPWSEEPAAETAPARRDFLDNLSALFAAVRSGDEGRARLAADALEHELLAATAASSSLASDGFGRLLDHLRALIHAARLGDAGGAQSAARNFACDVQSALVEPSVHYVAPSPAREEDASEPSALGLGATAAYENLMELDEAGADAPA